MKRILFALIILLIGTISFGADFSTHKLDNGQTVIIQEVHDNPIVIIDTWIKTGSINETDENNGVAHFLEHLFFKGTSKHPAKEFDTILESKGALTNAATSKDFTHYYIFIPSKDLELALDLHSDMLLNPMIPRKELEKERKVVLEEIAKNNDRPSNILYKNLIKGFYKIHPYKRETIGTKEVIETISREQIFDFYNKWYTPENMTTVIVGDVDTEKTLNLVREKFNKAASTEKHKTVKYKIDKKPTEQIEIKQDLDIQTGYIIIGYKGCHPMTNKDAYALDVLATVLGEGKSSRLYKSIKDEKQLVHAIDASHGSMKDDSIFYISANYTTHDIEKLKDSIFNEVEKVKNYELPEDEIQKAKNIITRNTYYSRESVSNIAEEIGYTVTLTNSTDYYKNYIENINKVTAKDIKKVAKEYLNKDTAVISIILPSKEGKKEIKPQEPKEHNAKVISQKGNTTKYELDNGATLIITQNTLNDIIAIEMTSRGGNNEEKIKGTSIITGKTILKGTKKYKDQELARYMEENGIKISIIPYGDSFGIDMKFTKNDIDLALDIFKEISKEASFEPSDIEKAKTEIKTSIKNMQNTPDSIAFDEYKTEMWGNTPFGNSGKILEKTIPTIQKEDIEEFYKNTFKAQNTIITINGNVDEKKFINYFSELISNDNSEKTDLKKYKNNYKTIKSNKTVKINKDSQAAWLILGWQTDGIINEKEHASLQIIDAILGSGMSSRMFTTLRDEQGLAYQVGSSYTGHVNKGAFTLYIATNPENCEKAKTGMLNEINKLKTEFVTDKELAEAKDKILGNFVLSQETNMNKCHTLNYLEIIGKDYTFIDKYPALINSVTLQDVIRTANKYFSKPYIFVVVGPKESIEKL